jgi:hypothetical protein
VVEEEGRSVLRRQGEVGIARVREHAELQRQVRQGPPAGELLQRVHFAVAPRQRLSPSRQPASPSREPGSVVRTQEGEGRRGLEREAVDET